LDNIQDFLIEQKPYNIFYDSNDSYFNSNEAKAARIAELHNFSQILHKYCFSHGSMIDIGANIGLVTLLMSQFANSILSIEPNKDAFDILKHNCHVNQINSILKNCAVGKGNNKVRFLSTSVSTTASHVVTKNHISTDFNYEIPIKKLDDIVKEEKIKDINFIKIDVEGHEWPVLRGAKKTIRKFNPWILLEFNSYCLIAFSRVNPRDFLDYLLDNFQQVGQVNPEGEVYWINNKSDALAFLHDNLVKHTCIDDLLLRFSK
jgi:FkbM family methyltransferase